MAEPVTAPPSLAETLAWVASDLDAKGHPFAGALRQAAREIRELRRRLDSVGRDGEQGCAWCGSPILQPVTGRPRRYCSDSHRKAAGRKAGKTTVSPR